VGGGMANVIVTQGINSVLRLPVAPLLVFKAVIRDGVTKRPLAGVSVKDRNRRIDAVSDVDGKITVSGLTAGYYNLTVDAEKSGYLGVSSPQAEADAMPFRDEIPEKNLSFSINDLTPEVIFFCIGRSLLAAQWLIRRISQSASAKCIILKRYMACMAIFKRRKTGALS
jgi:hypothetical protein